jgi:hydrogenase maturation protease
MDMKHVLLIGYGNRLRGDDALGPLAIERLRARLPEVESESCHQLAPELAAPLAQCELAVFVDAAASGEPGTVQVQRLYPTTAAQPITSHHLQPAALLALAQALYGHAPEAWLVTGSGERWESGAGLSARGAEALDAICRLVPRLLQISTAAC